MCQMACFGRVLDIQQWTAIGLTQPPPDSLTVHNAGNDKETTNITLNYRDMAIDALTSTRVLPTWTTNA
ncbi:hypothetical protein JYU34_002007 [Plutella xylostella]|uniref:Uncharacterized protein n=1 Tax=Plutella xylostella TaxID=51655 RepID=A0ABQ7R5B3_PLUXY|nr:hypothetical protein JYU34_002007 [Plutella xylostella]